jgi:formate dehydrogenase assembly factor FdhD
MPRAFMQTAQNLSQVKRIFRHFLEKQRERAFQEHCGTAKTEKLQPTMNKGQQMKIRRIRTRKGKKYVEN